ncbi:hypothetical protein [Sulfolobus acidocaldarius]|uniref:Uncharacterized protein n=4 Tax=Sulfolobus acidocaldarius TaxID=2285 RepID=Q4JBU9_SULAC|nr:hypothetical protein [Sulfolobus acidocaldarius]AAY79730.1 hypothetical protein Saci_0314 [Sulfolobus acidocaldarius DSM 639]AGE70289.1 hypothetical protein SacN8_01540 [Sulfolobus acidocaldarius N8]AGE72564.1 hypothetical protein SacRon12I_01540 [Sulfolobus acidocaldarius Ron12/I]ALU29310.1 hypothetical protein ATY89_04710 [Sulfolobus acidocaldarius]ALU32039.1 hypothetical protein ATZ20_07735 [Sulfolobus acidocaldarius]
MPPLTILADVVLNEIRDEIKRRLGKQTPEEVTVRFVEYLPPQILGYVRDGDYTIYVNLQQYTRARSSGYEYEYLYVILLHEYLHLIGIADEREVRRIDLEIIEERFGQNSRAYRIALELADPRDVYLKNSQKFGRPNTYI